MCPCRYWVTNVPPQSQNCSTVPATAIHFFVFVSLITHNLQSDISLLSKLQQVGIAHNKNYGLKLRANCFRTVSLHACPKWTRGRLLLERWCNMQNCLTHKHLKGAERSLAWLTTGLINSASSVCIGRILSQPVTGGEERFLNTS